jgi:hypothetical protein
MERLDRAAARVEPVFVVVAGLAAAAAILLVTGPHGPALSPDSAAYVSAAEHLADGEGLTAYGGSKFVHWPPGFPLLLAALVEIFEVSAITAGRVANAVLLACITGVAWLVLRRVVTSATVRVVDVSLVAGATSLHMVSSYVWSEPLFVLMTLLALLALNEAIRRVDSADWLIVAALVASSCFFVRYIGVVVIATGTVAILVAGWRQLSHRRRLTRAAVFAGIASAGPVAWVVRNLSVSDTVAGGRAPADASLAQNAHDVVRGLGALVVPPAVPARGVVLILLCAVTAAALLQVRSTGLGGGRRFARLLAGFFALYLVVLVATSSMSSTGPLEDRLLSPVFVPLVALAAAVLDRAAVRWHERRGPYWALVGPGALALCAAGLAWGTAEAGRATADGLDYAGPRWRDSDLVATVERAHLPATVYSNVPGGLFLHTSIDARCWPDELALGAPCNGLRTESADLARQIGDEPAALILFSPDYRGQEGTPEIPRALRVTRTTDATDGGVYVLRTAN